ncbi:MAG: ABC transporter ATP-binding protein [Thermodesulfobacteriota bacterium]|jgi:iron complex transport system ATP-binding protein
MNGSALSILNLSFGYRRKLVLHNIRFTVERGSICGLLGPNASGKTTLLKCINGVLKPKEGQVRVNGSHIRDLSRREIARLMAVVPQQTTVVFSFTALQMVVMGRAARLGKLKLPSRQDYRDAEKTLEELKVGDLAKRPFNELSGGERQLIVLARALFQDTLILLMDEPTSHLDFKNQFMIMDMVREVTKAKRLATVISLHDPNLAARYCSQMVMLKEGRILQEGPRETVFGRKTLEAVYGMKVIVENTSQGTSVVIPEKWTRGNERQ